MPYTGILIDGSVTNAKIAAGTISGDRLAANLNYAGDMTVQRLCANKCLTPAVCAYSCCCYGGHFYGACGICSCGCCLGAMVCAGGTGLCVVSAGGTGGVFVSGGLSACLLACCWGVYTTAKAYVGGGLVVAGCAGDCEGAIAICGGCMCYYSGGIWHPVCKTL